MPNLKASEEFVVGKHNIGWIDSDFIQRYGKEEFTEVPAGTYQVLPRYMNDAEIESELKPGLCTLGDVLTFIMNPPEGTKDGYSNIFYVGSFVVGVGWVADHGRWSVSTWRRGVSVWIGGSRVFSPANLSSEPQSSSVSLNLTDVVVESVSINGVLYKRVTN